MKQTMLANNDFEQFCKATPRDRFLAEMNAVVRWSDLVPDSETPWIRAH